MILRASLIAFVLGACDRDPASAESECPACRTCLEDLPRDSEEGEPAYRNESRSHRETPFASCTHALRELVINRIDGYAMPNVDDPSRLKALVEQGAGSRGPRAQSQMRELGHAEHLAIVSRSLEAAFVVSPDPRLSPDECKLLLLARFVANCPPADLADRMTNKTRTILEDEVVRLTSWGWRRVAEPLALAELIPPLDDTHYDLRGWVEVGDFLGVSARTAMRWYEAGMPVRVTSERKKGVAVEAWSEELRRWKVAR